MVFTRITEKDNSVKRLKLLSVLLGILISLSFSGCAWCTTIEYIDRPVEVFIPVKCKVKDVRCNLGKSDAELVVGLTECIIDMKKEARVCQ